MVHYSLPSAVQTEVIEYQLGVKIQDIQQSNWIRNIKYALETDYTRNSCVQHHWYAPWSLKRDIFNGLPDWAVEKHLPYFPIWKRLHTHLRTSPHYNMLYTDRLIRGVHETGQNIQSPGSTAPMTATQVEGKRKPLPSKRLQDNIKIGSSASNNSDETYEPSLFSGDSEVCIAFTLAWYHFSFIIAALSDDAAIGLK